MKRIPPTAAFFLLLAGAVPAQGQADPAPPPPPPKSRVVLVERPAAVDQFAVNGGAVERMWTDALLQYTGKATPAAAWKALGVAPTDTVGIKVTANGSDIMSTRVALVNAIAFTLTQAGVSIDRIVVWDRDAQAFTATAYAAPHPYQVRAVVADTGYDAKAFYVSEYLGKLIWGDLLFQGKNQNQILAQAANSVAKTVKDAGGSSAAVKEEVHDQTSNRSYIAKLVTQTCTKIVNVPALIDSDTVGLGGCLSTLALDSVDNTRRFLSPEVHGDPAIAEILDRDAFRKKVVLHVLDGLIAQYAGGPNFAPQFTQSIGALYVGADPVAIDSLALPRIAAWRAASKVVAIGDLASHIHASAVQGLGTDDPKQIDLVRIP